MAGDNEIFVKVREAVNIVDVIGEHLALRRAGREFKCLCPFHDDHRPSMAVVPHKQIFHCFVCGMGGDVFKFVKEYHKMTTAEALRFLAQKAGIALPEFKPARGSGEVGRDGKSLREQIAETNEKACTFFENSLFSDVGKAGLAYLRERGLTDDTIKKFRLGFAPEGWTALCSAAFGMGLSIDHLDAAGLIKKRSDGSPYDAFRNRVMFPIIDAQNRVIAFGGRVLVEKRDEAGNVVEAKYLNSPETRLFNKSEAVYGINHARQAIVRSGTALIVEGYMDVIASHQTGTPNAIATLGTALTQEHVRALKNYASTIVLLFDSDDAGRRAADRAIEVFSRTTLDVKITSVPDGKDPCDYCIKLGDQAASAMQSLMTNAADAMTYKWRALQREFNTSESVGKRQDAAKEFIQYVGKVMQAQGSTYATDPIRKGLLITKLSSLLRLPTVEVLKLLVPVVRQADGAAKESAQNRIAQAIPGKLLLAEKHILGILHHDPKLYETIREEIRTNLFTYYTTNASLLIEFLEFAADLSAVELSDFLTHIQESDEETKLTIELYRDAGLWIDPQHLEKETARLIEVSRNDRGVTLMSVLSDCMGVLLEGIKSRQLGNGEVDFVALSTQLKEANQKLLQTGRTSSKIPDFAPIEHPQPATTSENTHANQANVRTGTDG